MELNHKTIIWSKGPVRDEYSNIDTETRTAPRELVRRMVQYYKFTYSNSQHNLCKTRYLPL